MKSTTILARLHHVRRSGRGWTARWPVHDDHENSLSIGIGDDARVLIKCHAGCASETILTHVGLTWADLFPDAHAGTGQKGVQPPTSADAGMQAAPGCTLIEYATAKALPQDFLRSVGVTEISYLGRPALRISYLDTEGQESPFGSEHH